VRARNQDSGHWFVVARGAIGRSSKWFSHWDDDKLCYVMGRMRASMRGGPVSESCLAARANDGTPR
jgi:hypothetical protein